MHGNFQWWPRVAKDSNLLIATEVGLAATLVLMFNAVHVAWEDRSKVRAADMAALVYARHRTNWLATWRGWVRRERHEVGVSGRAITAPGKPAWALRAGFANRFEAENAGCFEHNANAFASGKRVEPASLFAPAVSA